MTRKQPNVLPITTDQQRYDTLGIVGNPYVRTPNLDRLAATGVQLTQEARPASADRDDDRRGKREEVGGRDRRRGLPR
ncbi:MAG TPA: hypothetical protein VKX96_02850 [Chloroflexota bacterium]|nr:hypothetical protein [Chloroflexota bacterium]